MVRHTKLKERGRRNVLFSIIAVGMCVLREGNSYAGSWCSPPARLILHVPQIKPYKQGVVSHGHVSII